MENNSQQRAWEREYQDPGFISMDTEPQQEIKRFLKWLKKEGSIHYGYNILQDPHHDRPVILDLGCGTGRNLIYPAKQYGTKGYGYDFSQTAISQARRNALGMPLIFDVRSIGEEYPLEDQSVDIVFDITASHALYEGERNVYLREVKRVLKPNGLFVVRTLCLDSDKNAKNLIKMFAGPEPDTYILPEQDMMEKVFSEKSFRERYEKDFEILEFQKPSGYQRWGSQSFKRRYIVAYMKKRTS